MAKDYNFEAQINKIYVNRHSLIKRSYNLEVTICELKN